MYSCDTEAKVCAKFGALFDNEKFADLTLIIGDAELKAHRLILAASSPVFDAMLGANWNAGASTIKLVENVSVSAFREFIRFLYSGRCESVGELAYELVQLAHKYDISDLAAVAADCLAYDITEENVFELFAFATLYDLASLKRKCAMFFADHRAEIVAKHEWTSLADDAEKARLAFALMNAALEIRDERMRELESVERPIWNRYYNGEQY